MFEKEAEEYLGNFADCANCKERWSGCADSLDEYCLVNGCCYATPKEQDIYIAGAEFGYNKANEWQFLKTKDDLPKPRDNRRVLTWYGRNIKEGMPVILDANRFDVGGAVIAWKEIVLPELPKESE